MAANHYITSKYIGYCTCQEYLLESPILLNKGKFSYIIRSATKNGGSCFETKINF